jgi:hypothetical protein
MDHREHRLIIEYVQGIIRAHCACGAWDKPPVSTHAEKLRNVFTMVEDEHTRHVEEAEKHELAAV